jgi:23S rRNA (uracil1939-C5)-methyltransferase
MKSHQNPQSNYNHLLSLTIEKLIYGGDGLARLPADASGPGKAIFIPFVLPGEQVEAEITEHKPGFSRAQLQSVVVPSASRISPPCPYFARCRGCHYQHTTYDRQLQFKADILKENLKRIAKLELATELQIHPSPPWEYRNRARFQVRTIPDFALGYYRFASHDILPIDRCPINSPLINRALSQLVEFGRARPAPASVKEIEFFAGTEDEQLLAELTCMRDADPKAVQTWADQMSNALPEVKGIAAFQQPPRNAPRSGEGDFDHLLRPFFSIGNPSLTCKTASANFRVSAGAFFQVNRHMIDRLVDLVTHGRSGIDAVDLYAGVGLFSATLARSFRHTQAVESSPISYDDLVYNSPENVKAVRATTETFLERASRKRKPAPDLVVVDPPRSGLRDEASRLLAQWQPRRITYVSCDPATLARDLVPLLAAGYKVEQAHLIDLFPQTYHLESVLHLSR